ncbi:MAG: VWA domain-containing protein, partial [FCB group bacterium]|nr:VWA domain-containing protein [FCB group bacterium]
MDNISIEFLSGRLWLTVLFGLAFLGVTWLYYRRTTPPLKSPLKILLGVLRGLALVALFLALTQPILTLTNTKQLKKKMALLLDVSASMNLSVNQNNEQTRLETAREIIDGPALQSLRDNLDISYFTYAESLAVSLSGESLSGHKTDPGMALGQLARLSAVDPYDYLLLLSDGRTTEGAYLPDIAEAQNRPVYTVAVGDTIRTDDIALDLVSFDEIIYAGRKTEIAAVISQQGDFGGKLQLKLADGNNVLTQNSITPPGDEKSGEYTLNFTPTVPGRLILDVEAAFPGEETNRLNNRRKISIRVLKSKLNILIYSSSLNQEYAFLNRYLKSREDYKITRVIDAPGGERLGQRFPSTQESLNSFDLIIMIDPNLRRLSSHHERLTSYLIDRGGGLLVYAGEEYAKSAPGSRLAELLPITVSTGPTDRTALLFGEYNLVPDQRMIFHPAIKLGDTREEIVAAWANQPPFATCIRIDSLRSQGAALAYLDDGDRRRQIPALAMQRHGAGKVLSVAVSPFWHWAFYPVGVGGDASAYTGILSATIRWLTIGDESDRVEFKPAEQVFQNGEEVLFHGSAFDEGFRPIENGTGDLVVTSSSGDSVVARILPDPDRKGKYRSDLGILPPGTYDYKA